VNRSERRRIEWRREVVITWGARGHIHGLNDRPRLRRSRPGNDPIARSPVKIRACRLFTEEQPRVLVGTIWHTAHRRRILTIDSFPMTRRHLGENVVRRPGHGRIDEAPGNDRSIV
jgi:hypothetical protein